MVATPPLVEAPGVLIGRRRILCLRDPYPRPDP